VGRAAGHADEHARTARARRRGEFVHRRGRPVGGQDADGERDLELAQLREAGFDVRQVGVAPQDPDDQRHRHDGSRLVISVWISR
jgi:hypothetical protein